LDAKLVLRDEPRWPGHTGATCCELLQPSLGRTRMSLNRRQELPEKPLIWLVGGVRSIKLLHGA
jgi:hypothetical protein